MNAAGLALVTNNLSPRDSRPGVPFSFLVRKALTCERTSDAIDLIAGARRASGANFMLGSAEGEIINIETTASTYAVQLAESGYVGHSNHYTDSFLWREYEGSADRNGNSILRLSRIRRHLAAIYSKAERDHDRLIDGLKLAARDHTGYPQGICMHSDSNNPTPADLQTVASLIMFPHIREVLVAKGNPCENEYQEFRLA
jgi:isopenicillin-N N-acyltransferase-like protein